MTTEEEIISKLTEKYYNEWQIKNPESKSSGFELPKFYQAIPRDDDVLLQKLREEARAVFLQQRSLELLDNTELQELWPILERNCSLPFKNDRMIDFSDFLKAGEEAGAKCKPYFTATNFMKLSGNDALGRISIMAFFNFVMKKVWLHQTRIGLSLYDVVGQGYLKEADLENYIQELIPTLPQLSKMEKSFESFYVCTAVRKFFFFLDPMRTGRVRISHILSCSFLDDLLELRDEEVDEERQQINWFSAKSAYRVYGTYLHLDRDQNGMLSRQELEKYETGSLTSVFVSQAFQTLLTYNGEMDYKTYLDLTLALENKTEPQSIQYLFRILDIEGRGRLTSWELNYFFRGIQEKLREQKVDPQPFQDIQDEIFDMVKPADPAAITLDDLVNCGKGGTVISILIDVNGFWTYENREMLVMEAPDDHEL